MSGPDQNQDTDIVWGISDLPAELRRQTAALVEPSSLPALRLVSHDWNKAANLAVRQLKHQPVRQLRRQPAQVRLIGQRWPNLERLELDLEGTLVLPDRDCRDLTSSLPPLTRLQHLSLGIGAALLPEGQEFMLRQTRLLSLRPVGIFGEVCLRTAGIVGEPGASDEVLQVIGRLSHLTRLCCALHAPYTGVPEHVARVLQPFQLEPATDEGVRCLSSLQSLKDLTLINWQANIATITGQALSSIGSLHQLTHLSLGGWPIVNSDLSHLTRLQLHSLELDTCLRLTYNCLMLLCLEFTSLRTLRADARTWGMEDIADQFAYEIHGQLPYLTPLELVPLRRWDWLPWGH